jgi:transcriptional regulator with XRE-family HTH domain
MQLEEIQKNLGNRIRELRQKKGWSQEEFADRCEVHRSFMGVIERGETNLTVGTLYKIASALETTVAMLLKGIV